jgi:hypothetical protein
MKIRKLTPLAVSVAALALFCLTAPSAKAQTYIVTITGGTGTCLSDTGTTGTLTLNTTSDTLIFTAAGDCYFGANGTGATATPDFGASTCGGSNCSTLPASGVTYTFSNQTGAGGSKNNAGACNGTSSTDCSIEADTFNFTLNVPTAVNGGFTSTSHSDALAIGGNSSDHLVSVQFDDATLAPEPSSYLLFGSGLLALGAIFRKKLGSVA